MKGEGGREKSQGHSAKGQRETMLEMFLKKAASSNRLQAREEKREPNRWATVTPGRDMGEGERWEWEDMRGKGQGSAEFVWDLLGLVA